MIIIVSYWWMKYVASLVYRLQGKDDIFAAQSFFIFIILRDESMRECESLINHEKIHFRQQLELLFIGQWLLYLLDYCRQLYKHRDHYQAYRNISFEKEAYENDENLDYLKSRKAFAWRKYW